MINIPPKVRLLSIGISDYSPHQIDLPASLNDARQIYDAFEDVLGKTLDHRHSIVALNITGDQFLAHLRTMLNDVIKTGTSDDVLIVYFSGHGTTYDDVLDLHFVDSAAGQGKVSSTIIGEMLRMYRYPRVLLVLDCCFSGLAKTITQTNTALNKKKTTLVASSQPFQPSKSGALLSLFTRHLSTALYKTKQQGLQISVANLAIELKNCDSSGQRPHIIFPEGESDLVLASSPLSAPQAQQLQFDIAERLRAANERVRESVWYALAEEPEYVLLGVANILFQDDKYTEPSWLVRRAAGSALSEIAFLKNEQLTLCRKLLNSKQWTNRCIGILTVRRLLTTDEYRIRLEEMLHSDDEPMDVRWLSFLYLSDHYGCSSFEKLIKHSNLDNFHKSSWGMCELWERGINKITGNSDISIVIEQTQFFLKNLEQHSSTTITFLYLRYREVFDGLDPDFKKQVNSKIVNTKGISCFATTPTRGSGQTLGIGKWLHSSLYGSWRGAYRALPVFDELTPKELADFIAATKDVPIIAARMAIFEQLEGRLEIASQLVNELSWGLSDAHPWVRRAATRLFRTVNSESSVEENEANIRLSASAFNSAIYPGELDHIREILHWANQLGLPQGKINGLLRDVIKDLSANDRSSLNQDSAFECRSYRF